MHEQPRPTPEQGALFDLPLHGMWWFYRDDYRRLRKSRVHATGETTAVQPLCGTPTRGLTRVYHDEPLGGVTCKLCLRIIEGVVH